MPEALAKPASTSAAPVLREAGVASIATALPRRRVDSAEIAERLGIDPDWITSRTGIEGRRMVSDDESLTGLAVAAGRDALQAAGVDPAQVELVVVATFSADRVLPNAAPVVAYQLGAHGAGAFDLGVACTGFLSALSMVGSQIESGRIDTALVIGADVTSRLLDHSDRKTAGLFADGAGAAVLTAGGPGRLGRIALHSDGAQGDLISVDHSDRLIRMRGQDTFREAVDKLSEVTLEILTAEGLTLDDVDLFVYHQANARITRAVGERLGLPLEKVVDCIAEHGNTSAATLPLALDHAAAQGQLVPGSLVLLAAFGAGLAWGGGLLEWQGTVAN